MSSVQPTNFHPELTLRELLCVQGSMDVSLDFQALVLTVQDHALVLIFQGKKIEGSSQESQFLFPKNVSVQAMSIMVSKKFIPHFFSSTNASFTGSYNFAALVMTPSDLKPSSKDELETAFQTDGTPFYTEKCKCVRLPDRWVNFNHLGGLKFSLQLPCYMEIRAHQRDQNLFDGQKREIKAETEELVSMKEKELQLIDKKGSIESQIAELVKANQEHSDLDRQLAAVIDLIKKTAESIKLKSQSFSALIQRPPIHAASGPVLRVLTKLPVTQFQEAGEQLALAFSSVLKLNETHFNSQLVMLHENFPKPLKDKKVHFFTKWLSFLETNHVNIVVDVAVVNSENLSADQLSNAKEHLTVIGEALALQDHFEAGLAANPTARYFLTNANNAFVSSLRTEVKSREAKLEQFIFNSICALLKHDPQNYLSDCLVYLFERCEITDQLLLALGLIDPTKSGEQKYLSSLDYARARAFADDQITSLSFVSLLYLLEANVASPLLPVLSERVKANIPVIPMTRVLGSNVPALFASFTAKRERVIDTFNQLVVLIQAQDPMRQTKWLECKQAIQDLLIDLPANKTPFAGSYDDTLAIFLRALPNGSPEHKKTAELKKALKGDDLMKIGDLASILVQLPQNTVVTTALLQHLINRALSHLKSTLVAFPKLKVRNWVARVSDQQLIIRKHIYWPKQGSDPFYMANETHLPL